MDDLWDLAGRAWDAVAAFESGMDSENRDHKKRRRELLEVANEATRTAREAEETKEDALTPLFKRFRRYARHDERCTVHIDDSIVCDLDMKVLRPRSDKCSCGLTEFLKEYQEVLRSLK